MNAAQHQRAGAQSKQAPRQDSDKDAFRLVRLGGVLVADYDRAITSDLKYECAVRTGKGRPPDFDAPSREAAARPLNRVRGNRQTAEMSNLTVRMAV
jgi:hypothetical protein